MAEPAGSLEISQDLAFQQREWRVQRLLWAVLALLLGLGLVGVFGSGPVAHATAEAPGLAVAYERIARKRAPHELRFVVDPSALPAGGMALWIDAALLDKLDIQRITPEPDAERAGPDRVVFAIDVADAAGPVEVVIDVEPSEPGGFAGRAGIVDGPEVGMSGFVLP